MEIRMDSQQGPKVSGIDAVLAEIRQRLKADPKKWLEVLQKDPGNLANLEQEIHGTFAHLADRVVAGLLAQATGVSGFAEAAKKK